MRLIFIAALLMGVALGPTPQFCAHALALQSVAAQETKLPADEWCQRAPSTNKKSHACKCHQASCSDPDPNHLPAHTDAMCLSYCRIDSCRCAKNDCP